MVMETQCYLTVGKDFKTHIDGTFYQKPKEFPVVLLDRLGCVCLDSERYTFLVKQGTLKESTGGKSHRLNIAQSIQRLSDYQICPHGSMACPKYRGRTKS